MSMGDIWGATDTPKRKKPEVIDDSKDAAWTQWHMNRIRDWMSSAHLVHDYDHDAVKIMRILGCGASEYDDLLRNRPNYFTLQRIKAIHINLQDAQKRGETNEAF